MYALQLPSQFLNTLRLHGLVRPEGTATMFVVVHSKCVTDMSPQRPGGKAFRTLCGHSAETMSRDAEMTGNMPETSWFFFPFLKPHHTHTND